MKISTYKLAAKRIINEHFWKCIAITFFMMLPKLIFIVSSAVLIGIQTIIGFSKLHIALFICIAFGIFSLLDVFSVSSGELMLWSIAENDLRDTEDADSRILKFMDSFRVLAQFGISNVFKLRLRIVLGLAKDILIAVIPPLVLTCTVVYFIFSAALPVSAFVILILGVIAIFILALYQVTLEYDKYRFVYKSIGENYSERAKLSMADTVQLGDIPTDSTDSMFVQINSANTNRRLVSEVLEDSKVFADKNMLALRKGEKSFFVKCILLFFLGPLNIFLPLILLYGMPYKKLTMHLIACYNEMKDTKESTQKNTQDTVIFSLKSEA